MFIIYPNLNGGSVLNDYYNLTNILFHEEQHNLDWKKYGLADNNVYNHLEIVARQISHDSFEKMNQSGKEYITGVYKTYIQNVGRILSESTLNALTHGGEEGANKLKKQIGFTSTLETYQKHITIFNSTMDYKLTPFNPDKLINDFINKAE